MPALHLALPRPRLVSLLIFAMTSAMVFVFPMALQAQSAPEVITFDDTVGQNRVLNGPYPNGEIDWGTNVWYLSAPWRQFTTKSIGFNGPTPTSGSFTFLVPRTLLQLDAFNGGTTASTISLTCPGQPIVSLSVAANTLVTISTGWMAACTSVQITSTNGWHTNFDNLVIALPAGFATPTPTPPGAFTVSDVRVSGSTATSVTIAWATGAASSSQINYGASSAYGL